MSFQVEIRINESSESLIRRFIRKTKKEKLIQEVKSREAYTKPSEVKRRQRADWRRRINKQMREEKNEEKR